MGVIKRGLLIDPAVGWGAWIGFVFSIFYLAILIVLSLLVIKDVILAGLLLLFGLLFGVVPAMILGTVTGVLISLLMILVSPRATRSAVILGSLLPALLVIVLLGLTIADPDDTTFIYFALLFGLPCILYITAGAWLGKKLYTLYMNPLSQ